MRNIIKRMVYWQRRAVSLALIAGCAVVSRYRFALAAILVSIIAGWGGIYLREALPSLATVFANLAASLVFLIVLTSVVGHAVFAPASPGDFRLMC